MQKIKYIQSIYNYKVYTIFWLHVRSGPLTLKLFKSQLYIKKKSQIVFVLWRPLNDTLSNEWVVGLPMGLVNGEELGQDREEKYWILWACALQGPSSFCCPVATLTYSIQIKCKQ